jgi:formate-dependent nitrite reductase cytochrome c552 subunit
MRENTRGRLTVLTVVLAAGLLAGCSSKGVEYTDPVVKANESTCGTQECHPDQVTAQSSGAHARTACGTCHAGVGAEHAEDPKRAVARIDWTIGSCARCHEGQAATYLYDDNAQAGPFGGSIRVPPQPKALTFPEYKTIVAGHPFTRDYNEEGSHAFMLEDHYETLRGKFETCVQCKSSKLAYAWKYSKPLLVASDTVVTLTHTATEGVPPKKVTVPKGTIIIYKTDIKTRQVDATAKLPDGTTYTSRPTPSEDATLSNNMLWASTIAAIKETQPYGAGCNHCHDPHSTEPRLLRQAMLQSIEGTGGIKGEGGVNPYAEGSPKDPELASVRDQQVLACAQCHVEYVCGKSGIDKVDRDAYGWSKAKDLHDLYTRQFGYAQDFKNALMGEPLIKSQHPETELFWESAHYNAGASCSSCHMPEVKWRGETMSSHWFTSPYKYSTPELWTAFVEATGVDAGTSANPCTLCHEDRTERAKEQQQAFYAAQAVVEKLLAQSVKRIAALKSAGKNGGAEYQAALESHQRASAVWENIAVSENSMGFHNFEESMTSMSQAEKDVRDALRRAAELEMR